MERHPLDNLRRSTTQKYGDWTHHYNATTQRLDRIAFTGPGGASIISYGYDARGRSIARTTSGDAQTFAINLADRVTAVTGTQSATYRYDGHGRRTQVTKAGTTTVQVYSQAGQLMYQSSPASDGIFKSGFQTGDIPYGAPTGGNTRYVYLGRHLIAEDGTRGRQYLHTDALGSPVRTTTASGAPSGREDYKPYGWGPLALSRPGFTGHVADAETGLIYMQARYYDPYAARFLSTDPVGVGSDGGNFNRYWYANNNPYRDIDPDGRLPLGSSWFGANHDSAATQQAAITAAPTVADFTPGVGDVKGFVDAYNNPSIASIGAAAIGLFGPVGDGVAKLMKGADNIADPLQTIYRRGNSPETATRLEKKASDAENSNIGIHGVSGSTTKPDGPCSSTTCGQLEAAGFKVHDTPTRVDLGHKTIELPSPVTREDAKRFNSAFGRDK